MFYYSPLSRRLRAVLLDGLFLGVSVYALIFLVTLLGLANHNLESIIIIVLAVSLEPFFVSFSGASIGQHLSGIRVTKKNGGGKVNILLSYVRFFVKIPLGVFSLITVMTTKRYQSIHDLAVGSIVVHKNVNDAPFSERLRERIQSNEHYIYPAIWRRLLIIFTYLVFMFIFLGMLSILAISQECLEASRCTIIESSVSILTSIFFYVGVFSVIGLGWQSRLYGCRRKVKNAQ